MDEVEFCYGYGRPHPPLRPPSPLGRVVDLFLFRCLAVGIAFRRDARPRPTVSATIIPSCYVKRERTVEDACPYRFVRYRTYYPHSNQLFIIYQRSDFIIRHSSFSPRSTGCAAIIPSCYVKRERTVEDACPYKFVRHQTYYPHSNQLFIIHQRSDFIIHHSSFLPALRVVRHSRFAAPEQYLRHFVTSSFIQERLKNIFFYSDLQNIFFYSALCYCIFILNMLKLRCYNEKYV